MYVSACVRSWSISANEPKLVHLRELTSNLATPMRLHWHVVLHASLLVLLVERCTCALAWSVLARHARIHHNHPSRSLSFSLSLSISLATIMCRGSSRLLCDLSETSDCRHGPHCHRRCVSLFVCSSYSSAQPCSIHCACVRRGVAERYRSAKSAATAPCHHGMSRVWTRNSVPLEPKF